MRKMFLLFLCISSFIYAAGFAVVNLEEMTPYLEFSEQIPPQTTQEWEFEVAENEQVFLTIKTRQMIEGAMGGFNYSIQFFLNDEPLRSRINRQNVILINRADSFTFRDGSTKYYDHGEGSWLAIFSNGYHNSPAKLGIKDENPYTYSLDITALAKKGKNKFLARNLRNKENKVQLIEVNLTIHKRPIDAKNAPVKIAKAPRFTAAKGINIDKNGALILKSNPEIKIVSAFSQPGGGFNYLGESKKDADENWSWQVESSRRNQIKLLASAKDYLVKRSFTLQKNRLLIHDCLLNLSKEDLVLRYNHAIDFSSYELPECRMGGQESHSLNDYSSAANSTMFFPAENSSFGIAVEDDFSRNQSLFYYDSDNKKAGFSNDMFYLEAGASYQTEWSLYLNDSDDYFDFINQIRDDWNLNYTIPAPVYFVGMGDVYGQTKEYWQKHIDEKKAKYICFWEIRTPADVKIPEADNKAVVGNGSALLLPVLAEARAKHIDAGNRWRELFPQLKVSQYYHCFFQGFEKPDDMTYQDSFIINSKGERLPSVYSAAVYYVFRSIYPMPGNSFWNVHIKNLDFLFNEMKIDWVYWDESNGPGTTAKDNIGSAPLTFNAEDGHSALIDLETNKILQKCAILAVVSAPALREGISRALAKDEGIVLFNGAPTLKYRSQPRVFSMQETQDVISRTYNTHLSTPLAYGYGTPDFHAIVDRLNYGCLYVRTHLNYECDAVSKCYPFTPMELHRGWIKGEERIITNHSGEFGWKGRFEARIWSYDKQGKKLDENPKWIKYRNKAKIEVPEGGLLIIEKQ